MERDGHLQMEVPLDAGLSFDLLKQLIDEAHDIVWNKLDSSVRLLIELGDLLPRRAEADRAADGDPRSERAAGIPLRRVARPAILLRTRRSSEAKIPLGATKIGGRPDSRRPRVRRPTVTESRSPFWLSSISRRSRGQDPPWRASPRTASLLFRSGGRQPRRTAILNP